MSSLFEYLQKLSNKQGKKKEKNVDPRLLKETTESEFFKRKYLYLSMGILVIIPLSIFLFIFSLKFLFPDREIKTMYKDFIKSSSNKKQAFQFQNSGTTVKNYVNNMKNKSLKRREEKREEIQIYKKASNRKNNHPKKNHNKSVIISKNISQSFSSQKLPLGLHKKKSNKHVREHKLRKTSINKKAIKNTHLRIINKENNGRSMRDFYKYVKLADQSFKKGNIRLSIKYYEKAYRIKKDKIVANNLVVLFVKSNLYDKAEKLIKELKDERLVYSYVIELVKKGLEERALSKAIQYIDYDKKGLIYFAKGYVYEKLGLYKKAIENYKEAINRDKNNLYFIKNYNRLKLKLEGLK